MAFLTVTRPIQTEKNAEGQVVCPEGLVACNPTATPGNTNCVKQEVVDADACPITEIKFVNRTDAASLDSKGYKLVDFGDQTLAFSKKADSKPLTTFKLSTSEPCLQPYEQPQDVNKLYFIGELGITANQCSMVQIGTGKTVETDTRYQPVGMSVSQFELEKASGVLGILESFMHYTFTVFPGSSVKNDIQYNLYARPTIDWKLECDLAGKKREDTNDFQV